jgi:acetyl-CoA synthetase
MSDKAYDVPAEWAKRAWVNAAKYEEMYKRSVTDPEGFWAEHGKRIDWFKPFSKVKNTSFDTHNVSIKWFEDGVTNVAHNCIDRHLPKRANQTAIIWEGDDPSKSAHITYAELAHRVGLFANVLKAHGVKKGDRVTIYLPMIPETAYAMLACARIGAIHSVVFGGFSPEAIAGRIADAKSDVVITADEGLRGGRKVPLKGNVDAAIEKVGGVKTVIVVRHIGDHVGWRHGRDVWLHEAEQRVNADCPPEPMKAEDPLFILYTSGSTGAPKGVLHTTGGYLVYVSMTHQYVFDYHDGDIYWCTADVGWVTGHSYILYGPLANGATTLMFEGVPNYPSMSRFWEVIDKHKVNTFYTAPTAIRSLMGAGEEPVKKTSRSSLRLLRLASPSIRKPGNGITASSAIAAARSSTPGGRPRPAAFSFPHCPERPSSNLGRRHDPSLASFLRSSTPRVRFRKARARATSSSPTPGRVSRAPCSAITRVS